MARTRRYEVMKLNGKEYMIRYTFNSMCKMEELTGKGIGEIFKTEASGLNTIRLLVWGGISKCKMSINEVGEEIEAGLEKGEKLEDYSTECSEKLASSGFIKNMTATD